MDYLKIINKFTLHLHFQTLQMDTNKSYHCTANGVYVCYTDAKVNPFIRYEEDSMLKTQLYGNAYKGVQAQDFEDNRYNALQNSLYQRCVYGLKVVPVQELAKLSVWEKVKIQYNHVKTQRLINLSKWKATSTMISQVFDKLFPRKSPSLQNFLQIGHDVTPEDNREINLGDLKLIGGKSNLIKKMIENEILPADFYSLKPL